MLSNSEHPCHDGYRQRDPFSDPTDSQLPIHKSLYPSPDIASLTGKWFTAPASLVYDLAAGITAPVFQRNQIRSMWNEARASQRIALSQYHETALKAYTEVLDLYCAGLNQVERVRLKEVETVAHQRSVTNANELFKLNYVGFLEVLSANERYLDSELERIDIITDLCRKKILLYRALGGGC